ncbi:hypothetical protein Acy02nite_14380 [Actinoplanes cyaneus]|uniref:LPXTG cell wall anchor domain-containing protein n=1 Tax=Actinoplanes cyaneus TaxID=52696 RepID=A0A919IFS1_9ACTN|nr:hypothetical protein [Actinoplanes cyaneus]GID63557.1 hypothetical protein Acy02nite_14380 [Actinoplanes cyaneus]
MRRVLALLLPCLLFSCSGPAAASASAVRLGAVPAGTGHAMVLSPDDPRTPMYLLVAGSTAVLLLVVLLLARRRRFRPPRAAAVPLVAPPVPQPLPPGQPPPRPHRSGRMRPEPRGRAAVPADRRERA